MPELPEVETVRRGLAAQITGAVIDSVTIYRDSCMRRAPGGPAQVTAELTGLTVQRVVRRGKFLWCEVGAPQDGDAPALALSAHLGMSGQFRVFADAPAPHRHCRARLGLAWAGSEREGSEGAGSEAAGSAEATSGSGGAADQHDRPATLDFLDQRTFGYLDVEPLVPTPDGGPGGEGTAAALVPASVAHIARDALDPKLDVSSALAALTRGARGIKQVLLDQSAVSGVGNIYADEALWHARVHPRREANSLSMREARDVLAAARRVMADALAQGGTSFDALYVNVNGESGYFSRSLEAYGREGEPCSRCDAALVRERIGGRSTHWCPQCQRTRARRGGQRS